MKENSSVKAPPGSTDGAPAPMLTLGAVGCAACAFSSSRRNRGSADIKTAKRVTPKRGGGPQASALLCLLLGLSCMVLPGTAFQRVLLSPTRSPFVRVMRSSTTTSSSTSTSPDTPPEAFIAGTGTSMEAAAQATFDRLFKGSDQRPIILFDGICVWCNTNVDVVARLDRSRRLRFASLQSPVGRDLLVVCGRAPDDLSSMVVVDADRGFHLKSDAVLRIAEQLAPFPWLGSSVKSVAAFLLPRLVRDGAYDLMGDNRYSLMGKRDSCRLPDPDDDRFVK